MRNRIFKKRPVSVAKVDSTKESNECIALVRPEHRDRLKQLGVYHQFINNIYNLRNKRFRTSGSFSDLIKDAFPIDKAPEGKQFWLDVIEGKKP